MIAFHNDHLISPVLCKLLYDTVPEEWHVPVVFRTSGIQGEEEQADGVATVGPLGNSPYMEVSLNEILGLGLRHEWYDLPGFPTRWRPRGSPSFRVWYTLLFVCYHEFGHVADWYLRVGPERRSDRSLDAWFMSERIADAFARQMIARVADFDKKIGQPESLGYLSTRLRKRINGADRWGWNSQKVDWLSEVQCSQSGGQMTTRDVAEILGLRRPRKRIRKEDQFESVSMFEELIDRVAADLGSKYVEPSGRERLSFAFGDLAEIARRVAMPRGFSEISSVVGES